MSPLILSHPLYTKTVSNLERTVVRDKLLRVIQYFSRFLSYYCYRKGYSVDTIQSLQALTRSLSLARKAFRAGRPLSAFRALAQELGNHTKPTIEHAVAIAKNLGSGLYLTFDTLIFLDKSGALKFRPQNSKLLSESANRFWLLSLVANTVDAVNKTHRETQRIKILNVDEKASGVEVREAEQRRYKALRMLVWNLLDALIPLSALKLIDVNDGLVGLAGTVTAYLGLKDAW